MNGITAALDLESVNSMGREDFVDALGSTFEHSPWIASEAWAARPFDTIDSLHTAMMDRVLESPRDAQIAFLCGHPELAGREAQARTMTAESTGEQAGAGLNALNRDEMADLRALNARYRQRHGFPFIIAARCHGKAEIFSQLRRRLLADAETELREALRHVSIITRLRLEDRLRP